MSPSLTEVDMAHAAPPQWAEKETINFDLSPIAQGSPAFNAVHAAEALTSRAAMTVHSHSEFHTSDLFLQGAFGESVPESPTEALLAVGRRISSETLGIPPEAANLRLKHTDVSLAGSHLRAQQTVENLPVYGSEITTHLDSERRPYAITGRPFPESLDASLSHPAEKHPAPATVVEEALGAPLDHVVVDDVAVLREGVFVPTFQIKGRTREPFGSWNALVSFEGELLAVYNIASSAYGEANAFVESPFRGAATRVRLDNLDAMAALDGRHVSVRDNSGTGVAGVNGAFFVEEDDIRFDEPNVYFFLDQVRIAFEAIYGVAPATSAFGATATFTPMRVTVHAPEAEDNAFYDPNTGELIFGDIVFDGDTRYTSRSRDIAIHEFGHATRFAGWGGRRKTPNRAE
jgi:hypothetical protein